MGWVNSPYFFCSASETITDNANAYVLDLISPFVIYPPADKAYHTYAAPQTPPYQLQYIDIYMEDMLCAAQGYAYQKKKVSELTLRSLKEIFPAVTGEIKDYDSFKKALARNGDLRTTKEILGWVVETNKGN